MDVNIPSVMNEVRSAFEAYENALITNDVTVLDRLFWNSSQTLRYGATENLVGYEAIQRFRAERPSRGLARTITDSHITTFGWDFAVANMAFSRDGDARIGRQSQTWVRTEDGWKVVAAHISWMGA